MGRHKDPEILAFVEHLKNKGKIWGFISEDEFRLLHGLYIVDLVWSYREEHRLFITFEIEKEENERIYKNLYKLFETPSSEIEKPYQHFLILYNGMFSKGNKMILQEKARRYNIHIFENLKNDSSEKSRFERKLEQLRPQIPEIIERIGEMDPAKVVRDTLRGLGNVIPILRVNSQEYPVNQSTLTVTSPTKVPENSLVAPSRWSSDGKKYEGIVLIPIPRKQFVLTIPNTSVSLDVYLMKREEHTKSLDLIFQGRELPCTVIIKIAHDMMGGGFLINLHPDRADVVDIKKFEDFLRAYNKTKIVHIENKEGRVIGGCEGTQISSPLSSNQWYEAISKLAMIQEKTSQRIPSPKDMKISPEGLMTIERTKIILEKGELLAHIKTLSVIAKKDLVDKLVGIQKRFKKISNLSFYIEQHSEQLIGQEIFLGPLTWKLPEMTFKEHLEEIEKRITDLAPNIPIEITLIPFSDNQAQIIYHNWKKQGTHA